MEFSKIVNLFDATSDDKDLPRFVIEKWIKVSDQSEKTYNVNKEIGIKALMLRSDLSDFSDAYIAVKEVIAVTNPDDAKRNKAVAFKNNAPFINCISEINAVQVDNTKDLDFVMPMYNFLEYSKKYRKTTGSLWSYYRDEPSYSISSNSESFKYKASITGNTYNAGDNGASYDADKVGKNEIEILKISMWPYSLMVNNIVRTKYILVRNIKIEILFLYFIFGLTFPKSILKVIFIYKKLGKMFKTINRQLKFVKKDQIFFLSF